jgi:hypothetical protein
MLKISGGDLEKSRPGARAKADARKNGSIFVDGFVKKKLLFISQTRAIVLQNPCEAFS